MVLIRNTLATRAIWVAAAATFVASAGCKLRERSSGNQTPVTASGQAAGSPLASGAASAAPAAGAATVATGIPLEPSAIAKIVNPRAEGPYSGATGTIRGSVTITGDDAPLLEDALAKIPADCKAAREMYERPFRVGMMKALADALVTVTGYSGYVPAKSEAVKLTAKDCAWASRTIALTLGQRLDVVSKDRGYVPKLLGASMTAQLVTIPGGDPVKLYPMAPGRYVLTDSGKPYMNAEVLVLKYATFDVTGRDGRYEIAGVPVGDVTVTAFLPATMSTREARVRVEAGRVHDLDLELSFDAKQFAKETVTVTPAPAGSAAPTR
jgi:hypothetical protein